MALTRTTLNGAITADDYIIRVTSATGFAKGEYLKVDDEFMLTLADASGTLITVQRGVNGTAAKAHVTGAGVVTGTGDEFTGDAVTTASGYPLSGLQSRVQSYTAAGAITLPSPGTEMLAILNGTTILAMTVAAPTSDMDGSTLYIASNGAAAHTVTFTGGLSGGGSSYDVLTVNATAPVLLGPFKAVNSLWQCAVSVPMAGTVTNITASLA